MTNVQLYLAIGLPVLLNAAMFAITFGLLVTYVDTRLEDLKELWRSELHRVEEVLDARLKHLEER